MGIFTKEQLKQRIQEMEPDWKKSGEAVFFANVYFDDIKKRVLQLKYQQDPASLSSDMRLERLEAGPISPVIGPLPLPDIIQTAIDSLMEGKDTPKVPFQLVGQTMVFSDGCTEKLNDPETEFIRIVIECSRKGRAADTDDFKDKAIYERRAIIRNGLKDSAQRTSALIKSGKGKRGYYIPNLSQSDLKN